jgi:O-antigen ligase
LRTKRWVDPPREVVIWVLYYLWMVASAFWAIDTNNTFKLLPTVLNLFALYIVVSLMRLDSKTLRIISGAVVAGATVASTYMLYMFETGQARVQERLWLRTDTVNVNPDHFAASLILPIAIAAIALLHAKSLLTRVTAIFCMGIMMAVIVLQGARGPEIALIAALGWIFIRDAKRWRLAGFFAVLAALVLIHSGPAFFTRWSDALSSGGAGRTDIWKVGWAAFKQNWLYGAGYNNFPLAYDKAFISVYQPFFEGWDRAAHSILLQSSVELGVIGLTLLLLGWWAQFRLLRHVGEGDERFPLRLAVEGSVIGLFICGLFALQMETKYVWLAFMLGIMIRNTRDLEPRTPMRLPRDA